MWLPFLGGRNLESKQMRSHSAVATILLLSLLCLLTSGCDSADQRAQSHYEAGLDLVAKGELTKASLEFKNALKLKGDFVEALFPLGEVEERQGDLQSAGHILKHHGTSTGTPAVSPRAREHSAFVRSTRRRFKVRGRSLSAGANGSARAVP